MSAVRLHPLNVESVRILAAGCEDPLWRRLLDRWDRPLDRVSQVHAGPARLAAGEYELLVAAAPGCELAALAERVSSASPKTRIVGLSPDHASASCTDASELGLVDLIGPPLSEEEYRRAVERLERALASTSRSAPGDFEDPFSGIIGTSAAIRRTVEVLRLIAPRRSTVLIHGATGSGKELAARAVHAASPRSSGPFVEVNCAAIPDELFESELFGHVKGAFTGAVASREGSFEQADGGTLFLDEVGELPLEVQPKLLRALQEREVRRVGGRESVPVDVRIVAATNRDLERMVAAGAFREDLYYRLAVVPAELPPLANRLEDVPALARFFLDRFAEREDLPPKRASEAAMARLASYHWPGNVRQLENCVEKAAVMSGDRALLKPSDFTLPMPPGVESTSAAPPALRLTPAGLDYQSTVTAFERHLIAQALEMTGGNKKRAADLLRMKRTTLNARWKALEDRC